MHQQILINLRSYLSSVYHVVCSSQTLDIYDATQLEWVVLSVTTQMYSLFKETSSVLYNQCPIILSPFPF